MKDILWLTTNFRHVTNLTKTGSTPAGISNEDFPPNAKLKTYDIQYKMNDVMINNEF